MRIGTLSQLDTVYVLNVIHIVILRLAALLKEFIILFWIYSAAGRNSLIETA
jgi:hypothetical protein